MFWVLKLWFKVLNVEDENTEKCENEESDDTVPVEKLYICLRLCDWKSKSG